MPRLELNAAYLLAKIVHSLSEFITAIPGLKYYCFTDYRNVFCCLQSIPHKLNVDLANHVVKM